MTEALARAPPMYIVGVLALHATSRQHTLRPTLFPRFSRSLVFQCLPSFHTCRPCSIACPSPLATSPPAPKQHDTDAIQIIQPTRPSKRLPTTPHETTPGPATPGPVAVALTTGPTDDSPHFYIRVSGDFLDSIPGRGLLAQAVSIPIDGLSWASNYGDLQVRHARFQRAFDNEVELRAQLS